MLLPFTLSWLQHEMQMQGDGVRVCTYGYLDEKNLLRLRSISEAVEHLQLTPDEDKGHFEATQNAIRKLSPAETDFLILLQSTQPLRRVGLL